jgi:hypothetical protein
MEQATAQESSEYTSWHKSDIKYKLQNSTGPSASLECYFDADGATKIAFFCAFLFVA